MSMILLIKSSDFDMIFLLKVNEWKIGSAQILAIVLYESLQSNLSKYVKMPLMLFPEHKFLQLKSFSFKIKCMPMNISLHNRNIF